MPLKTFQKKIKLKDSKVLYCIVAFLGTTIVILLLYLIEGYAPFGDFSLASQDANYQYLDLFAYLKDVIAGDNSIVYTLSKGLGGTGIAIFSYYLSSPFNLLIIFFSKSNLVTFFDIVIVLKLGSAALTMAYFLQVRFEQKMRPCFVVLLAMSYALMQYSIAQSCNIMWLDGVYMLPLMLLGVSKIVQNKKPWLLFFSCGLAILFNWYSAGINCLYTIIWFILEWMLSIPEHMAITKDNIKHTAKSIGIYIVSMMGGVMLSACLFLPTVITLSLGGRGTIDLSIFENNFTGNIINVIQNFTIGSISDEGSVSLYCGTLALIGCFGFFVSSKSMQRKLKVGIILIVSVMIFYWQPLFSLFSLLQTVGSYWYRYSYVTIFLIVFVAADYYSEIEKEKNVTSTLIKISLLFSAAILVLSWVKPIYDIRYVYYTCVFTACIAGILALYIKNISARGNIKRFAAFALSGVVILELMGNAHLLFREYGIQNVDEYYDYSVNQQAQIDRIQESDSDIYRISQTSTYNTLQILTTANYDEAMAYNYWSLSTYTSDPDDSQREFLDKLGYRINGENMNIVNTSILAVDSLLGVKYILSPYDITGLEKNIELGTYNGKSVYYNPYCLPMAFTYERTNTNSEKDIESMNPFEYQNWLYSELLGEEVMLYEPVTYQTDDNENDKTRMYTINCPEGNYALYGNITWDSYMNAALDVNDSYVTGYSRWASPSVFYIPRNAEEDKVSIVLNYEQKFITDEQFYMLDLDKLEQVSQMFSKQEADQIFIENTSAKFEVTANDKESLLITIPYNIGWDITLNGQDIEPEKFEDSLISVPLQKGENVIEMEYHVPGLNLGLLITGIAIAGAIIIFIVKRIKRHTN